MLRLQGQLEHAKNSDQDHPWADNITVKRPLHVISVTIRVGPGDQRTKRSLGPNSKLGPAGPLDEELARCLSVVVEATEAATSNLFR